MMKRRSFLQAAAVVPMVPALKREDAVILSIERLETPTVLRPWGPRLLQPLLDQNPHELVMSIDDYADLHIFGELLRDDRTVRLPNGTIVRTQKRAIRGLILARDASGTPIGHLCSDDRHLFGVTVARYEAQVLLPDDSQRTALVAIGTNQHDTAVITPLDAHVRKNGELAWGTYCSILMRVNRSQPDLRSSELQVILT